MGILMLTHHLSLIADPRQDTKVIYPLFDILFLTVVAVIGGSEGWEDIEDFGHCHLELLKKYGNFTQGIPVHDTIARVISRVVVVNTCRTHFSTLLSSGCNRLSN
jgi:predicted transposase YbfD/YdcC